MKCFPFMVNIEGRTCLLVGGGAVAARKAEKLAPFGVKLLVCAREVCPALAPYRLAEEYGAELLEAVDFVIAATDDKALNARVAEDCRARRIPVNSADDRENCDFYFPALLTRGDVTVGISTGGSSPALAGKLRRYLEKVLPPDLARFAEEAGRLRGTDGYLPYVAGIFDHEDSDGED